MTLKPILHKVKFLAPLLLVLFSIPSSALAGDFSYGTSSISQWPSFNFDRAFVCATIDPITGDNTGCNAQPGTGIASTTPTPFYLNLSAFVTYPPGYIFQIAFCNGACTADPFTNGIVYNMEWDGSAFVPTSGASPLASSTETHIVDFFPSDNAVVPGPAVAIREHIYINPNDLTGQLGILLTLHNIDQNVLLLGALSPSDIMIFYGEATTSGDVFIGGTYPLPDGNYRLNATLTRSYLYGWVKNPFSSLNENQSHQFVVGTSTFIGNLTQNGYTEFNSILTGQSATSTAALAGSCSPLHFDVINCLAFLLVPGGPQLNQTFVSFRDDVLQRRPWGYFGRIINILSASTTAALPTFTTSFQIGPPGNLSTTSLAFDPGDMLAGGAALLTSTRDPQNGKNMRDIFEPFVQLTIALAVIFTIFADLTGSHKHHQDATQHRV